MKLARNEYVPCLRWKLGEYQALLRSSSETRNALTPLLDIAEIGFDFETWSESKTVDKHLEKVARRVVDKWGKRFCFVDMRLIDAAARMADGQHPFSYVFDDLRAKGAQAIPVVGLASDTEFLRCVRCTLDADRRGICLRIGIEQIAKPGIQRAIDSVLDECKAAVNECDVVMDLGAPNFEPLDGFLGLIERLVRGLPYRDQWRSFTLLGTSFPASMGDVGIGSSIVTRDEWRLYKLLAARFKEVGLRIPNFGDYAINHPDVLLLDMRKIKPSANIRYTIENGWLIVKGKNVRQNGFGQFRGLCKAIVASPHFCGPTFSLGDDHILRCSRGEATTGNLSTWRWVGTNHHLEKVVRDLAILADVSDTA